MTYHWKNFARTRILSTGTYAVEAPWYRIYRYLCCRGSVVSHLYTDVYVFICVEIAPSTCPFYPVFFVYLAKDLKKRTGNPQY